MVDLIYKDQIMVGAEVKPRVEAALEKLKIKGVVVTNPANQQASTTAETTTTTANPVMMPPPSKLPVQMAKRKPIVRIIIKLENSIKFRIFFMSSSL